ncbi:MAG TPA: VWA domain-containing protein [Candidatus Competibacter sp.]|nr:VWA domain-containing protein [Candidatus Competibacteraceae bacterium]HRC73892.1 VWA domain-containing protein [Candidatus Competibacter sp.]
MDAAINRFVFLLKRRGARISPAESLDAMRALARVALHERDTVRAALRCTLIKNLRDLPLFEELFEQFFTLPQRATPAGPATEPPPLPPDAALAPPSTIAAQEAAGGQPDGDNAHEDALDIREYFDEAQMVTHFNSHQDPNDLSLAEFGQNLVLSRRRELLDQAMKNALQMLKARRLKNAGRAGELNFDQAVATLDAELIADAVADLLDELGDADVDEALVARLSGQLHKGIAQLPELLKRYLERELALRQDALKVARPARPKPDYRFSEQERRDMSEIVQRLCRRMRGARSYRRRISHQGRISVPLTLRRNMKYEGIPFQPVLTRYRDEKPRLAVICDVSLSVRNTARFMLHLVYNLQTLFERVRSFAFVSELAEISPYFDQLGIDEAIAAIFEGGLLDTEADSNYGRALECFHNRHLAAVTAQTTVIILGDGRGNRNPPQVWALEAIRRRAKQLLWLSPESRGSWRLGSCDMPLYESVCHQTEVVRNLQQLGQVTENLLRQSVVRP